MMYPIIRAALMAARSHRLGRASDRRLEELGSVLTRADSLYFVDVPVLRRIRCCWVIDIQPSAVPPTFLLFTANR